MSRDGNGRRRVARVLPRVRELLRRIGPDTGYMPRVADPIVSRDMSHGRGHAASGDTTSMQPALAAGPTTREALACISIGDDRSIALDRAIRIGRAAECE